MRSLFLCCFFLPMPFLAAEDFLQKKLKEDAQWAQAINRVSEIIEAAEDKVQFTENPPTVLIAFNTMGTVTVTGPIARRAYEMAQHKKNVPSTDDVLKLMQQFSDDKDTCKNQ